MPTINQLVRKGRKSKGSKSNSPALNFGYNSYKKIQTNNPAPQKRHLRNLTLLYVSMLVFVCLT